MKLNSLSRTSEKKLKAQTISFTTSEPQLTTAAPSRQNTERMTYAVAGGVLFALMFIGFQQFYLHGRGFPNHPIFPLVKGLVIAHGLAMTVWMVLFVLQTILIVNNSFRIHMSLGIFGIALAAFILVVSPWTAIQATRLEPDAMLYGLHRKQFLIVPLTDMLKFGPFVIIALLNRRRPEIHRPMMMLATLSVIAAATGRIPALNNIYASTVWDRLVGPYVPMLVFGAAFLVVKTILTKKFDRWFTIGFAALAAFSFLIWQTAPTVAWERVANFLTN